MKLYGTPLPLVAACTGHALAGGALVLLTADVRIAAQGAFRIGLNEVSIGLPVPMLAMELARDRIATTELGRATLRANIYTPDDAAKAGFVDEVVEAASLEARALEEAKKLGSLPRISYHETKKRLRGRTIELILSSLERDMAQLMSGV
jgi:enoyl-CoA hydratase